VKARVFTVILISVTTYAPDIGSRDAENDPDGGVRRAGKAQLELYWDNGQVYDTQCWLTGTDAWAANDFDIATLAAYNWLASARLYYYPNYPNSTFEGNRMAFWSFAGGAPASILWGPTYVRGTAFGWNSFAAGWSLGTTTAFAVAFEQYYN